MYSLGWTEDCGISLFTLGWVRCEISKGGSAEEVYNKVPPKKKEKLKKQLLGQSLDEVLDELMGRGTTKVQGTEVEFDSGIEKPEPQLTESYPPLKEIKDDVDRELAMLIRAQLTFQYKQQLLKYLVDAANLEEELIVFLMLIMETEND